MSACNSRLVHRDTYVWIRHREREYRIVRTPCYQFNLRLKRPFGSTAVSLSDSKSRNVYLICFYVMSRERLLQRYIRRENREHNFFADSPWNFPTWDYSVVYRPVVYRVVAD